MHPGAGRSKDVVLPGPRLLQCSDRGVTRCANGHLPFSPLSVEKRLKTECSAQHQRAQLAAHSASSIQLLALFQGDKACGFFLAALWFWRCPVSGCPCPCLVLGCCGGKRGTVCSSLWPLMLAEALPITPASQNLPVRAQAPYMLPVCMLGVSQFLGHTNIQNVPVCFSGLVLVF